MGLENGVNQPWVLKWNIHGSHGNISDVRIICRHLDSVSDVDMLGMGRGGGGEGVGVEVVV